MLKPLLLPAVMLLAGCGGDICDAAIGDISGKWTFATDDFTLVIDISEEGDVIVTSPGEPEGFDCELVSDDICNLDVVCGEQGGNDTFRFTLTRDE
jgi:hypothetical protein